MKPLPETYQGDGAFWVRMDPQPEGKADELAKPEFLNVRFSLSAGEFCDAHKLPYTIGETLCLREEWARSMGEETRPDGTFPVTLLSEYNSPLRIEYLRGSHSIEPAPTMPEWAAHQRFTVTGVEAKQETVIGVPFREGDDPPEGIEWGWYVTMEPIP